MAGLNFQTCTIINSNVDPDSKKNGVAAELFTADADALHVKRDFHFYKDKEGYGKVCALRKRAGYEAKLCKATIDFAEFITKLNTEKTYCRLDVYLGVEGNSEFIYSIQSPNRVLKGIPFWVEFTVEEGEGADKVAQKVAKAIKANHVFQCDKDLINITVTGTTLVLEGAREYARFRNIEISKFSMYADYADTVAKLDETDEEATDIVLNERGENSFGTYSQVTKDLRLPTAANYQPYHIRQVETPIIGAIYDQYIIEYAGPSANDGLMFVGQRGISNTLNVFWVRHDDDLIEAWETALGVLGDIEDVDATEEEEEVQP